MKTDTRQYLGWAARFRLFARVLGLTGLFAFLVASFLLAALGTEPSVNGVRNALTGSGSQTQQITAFVAVGGLLLAVLVLLLEFITWIGGSGQRSATGANSLAQVVLALAVFAGINVLAFNYFKRWDMTREKEFTLPTPVADELRKLKGQTTIIVLQQHKTFGQLSPKPDIYDYAAERKVVDKVHDLVDQFRLLGPQFRVVTLDVEAIGYQQKLDEETAKRPGLKEAIAAAPENSIFFYPDDRVETLNPDDARERTAKDGRLRTQADPKNANAVFAYSGNIPRLSFNEFYQLDKSASKAANVGPDGQPNGNLVLRPQGVEAFARRVVAIQEKRPKVGLLVIHEVLTSAPSSASRDSFTAAGLRRSLEDHGFEVVDVVLKKWGEAGGPNPAAYTLEETQFERLEAELEGNDEQRRDLVDERKDLEEAQKVFREKSLAELTRIFRAQIRREVTEDDRKANLKAVGEQIKQVDERLTELEQERRETDAQMSALLRNERSFEDRRVSDVKAKLNRLVSDCDLLIVPRLTVMNASALEVIEPSLYRLSTQQVEVVRDFMKTGKPVLVCVGPNAEPKDPETARRDRENPPAVEPLDDLERLLADRGIQLGRETIITNAEAKGFAARRAGGQLGGAPTDIPPATFPSTSTTLRDNPIAAAMRATSASADQQLDLRLQNPRPIYLVEGMADGPNKKVDFAPDFLMSPAASWNEASPMVFRNIGGGRGIVVPPRFRATPYDDPKKNTRDEVRRGPFSIGVAIEQPMPIEWSETEYSNYKAAAAMSNPLDGGLLALCLTAQSKVQVDSETKAIVPQTKRKTGRLVVIGQGAIFTGKQLSPAHEQLLLHTCNWLLKRDDRLPRTDEEWKYPRVQRDDRDSFLWKWGPFVGLPLLFLYLGLLVWIVRRVR
jgi:hypothetical protein